MCTMNRQGVGSYVGEKVDAAVVASVWGLGLFLVPMTGWTGAKGWWKEVV